MRGRAVTHYYVPRPEVAVIAARDAQGRYLLVRQYRAALDAPLLELPAGKCEPGESPLDCARRELEEETGRRPGRLEYLLSFYPSPGFSDQLVHAFRATELVPTATRFDPSEELELILQDAAACDAAIRAGEIRDGKTIVTLLADRQGLSAAPPR